MWLQILFNYIEHSFLTRFIDLIVIGQTVNSSCVQINEEVVGRDQGFLILILFLDLCGPSLLQTVLIGLGRLAFSPQILTTD